MSASAAPPLPSARLTHPPSLLARRIAARLIDDAILTALAIGLVAATATVLEDRARSGVVLTLGDRYGAPPSVAVNVPGMVPPLVVGVFALAAMAYYLWGAADGGRTLGRRALRLQVVGVNGAAAAWPTLLGREVMRAVMLSVTILVAWIGSRALRFWLDDLNLDLPTGAYDVLRGSIQWLLCLFVVAVWLGAALVDPLGRLPHDRLAGTLTVPVGQPGRTP